ncbi:MAG TPA: RNA methyltransferase [Candidatus Omnitrophota bacterium]|nr:RNA methyltransferase [Candidatus Omnitrophota bacterium]
MRKLTHEELLARQRTNRETPRLPFSVLLNNIRSLHNVGSIFRTADGAGVEKIYLCGITGHPPDTKITKTALGAEKEVPWTYEREAAIVLGKLKAEGYEIVLLEQLEQSVPYEAFTPSERVCLVVGNEIEGVSDGLLPLCDRTIEIGMAGLKNSLNVSVAFGIAAFHIRNALRNGYPVRRRANPSESLRRTSHAARNDLTVKKAGEICETAARIKKTGTRDAGHDDSHDRFSCRAPDPIL